ncbi:MAG: hypothetical protein HQK83_19710 [Fibrobacteria bacterium]|nr:hypothetical protein [Fibrobacteria bacterium]
MAKVDGMLNIVGESNTPGRTCSLVYIYISYVFTIVCPLPLEFQSNLGGKGKKPVRRSAVELDEVGEWGVNHRALST